MRQPHTTVGLKREIEKRDLHREEEETLKEQTQYSRTGFDAVQRLERLKQKRLKEQRETNIRNSTLEKTNSSQNIDIKKPIFFLHALSYLTPHHHPQYNQRRSGRPQSAQPGFH